MIGRRTILKGSAGIAALTAVPGLTLARSAGDARLVFVILRGALDGLAAVPPYAEPQYASLRGELALASPGPQDDGALKLDGTFALHPALQSLHAMYGAGDLAVVHAVATPYRERSHFDGQDVLENGGITAGLPRDGWLNRAVAALALDAPQSAIALAQNVPLVLRGEASVSSYAPTRLPEAGDDTFERIADLYAEDPAFAARFEEALQARAIAGGMDGMAGARGGQRQLAALVDIAAQYLSAEDGARIAVMEAGGWDTHANEGAAQGTLAIRLRGLDTALANLERALGPVWSRTCVVVATEFGRTAAVNGTRGTDHGTGACAFLAGGAVDGGRVVTDWPGLGPGDLYQGRDLKPTIDLRAVLKGVLRDHMGVGEGMLATTVFPDSAAVEGLEGLTKRI